MKKREAFISLKDHKENFENNLKCRLMNPAKSDPRKISKSILDKLHKHTPTVNFECKPMEKYAKCYRMVWQHQGKKYSFIFFDIVDFCLSTSENLLDQAQPWAFDLADISDEDISIIKHARKSLLFNHGKPWIENNNSNLFDVTMGSYDGAEICEPVGLFILNHLGKTFGKENIGLYRDDGLAIIKNRSARLADKREKSSTKFLNNLTKNHSGSKINLHVVNFLDVTFDLTTGKHKPYRKPSDDP